MFLLSNYAMTVAAHRALVLHRGSVTQEDQAISFSEDCNFKNALSNYIVASGAGQPGCLKRSCSHTKL